MGRAFATVVILLLLGGCVFTIGESGFGWNSWSWGPKTWVKETRTLELDPSGLGTLACKTHNGSVRVTGGPAAEGGVKVTAQIKAGGSNTEDAERCLEAIELTSVRDGDKHRLGWRFREKKHRHWGAQVAFTITQPGGLRSEVVTHNGRVEISGVGGGISARTHNGRVTLTDCAGDLMAETHNGGIVAKVESNNVSLETHNGGIEVVVDAEGSVAGEIITHNGSVSVTLSEDASTRVNCKTHNGRVRPASSYKTISESKRRREYVGERGSGSGRLAVRTHNGSITLN